MDTQNEQAIRRDILVALRYSYDEDDWVAPLSEVLDGVTVEEALWNPTPQDPDMHCVWEIVSHLTVWAENTVARRAQRQRGESPGRPPVDRPKGPGPRSPLCVTNSPGTPRNGDYGSLRRRYEASSKIFPLPNYSTRGTWVTASSAICCVASPTTRTT